MGANESAFELPSEEVDKNEPKPLSVEEKEKLFVQIYKHHQFLERLVAKQLRKSYGEAKDIVSGLFLKLWQNPPNLRDSRNLTAWLKVVASNYVIDFQRVEARSRISLGEGLYDPINSLLVSSSDEIDPALNPEEALAVAQKQNLLRKAVNALDPIDREILQWHYFEHMSIEDIKKQFGLSEAAIKSRLFRARASLFKKLKTKAFKGAL